MSPMNGPHDTPGGIRPRCSWVAVPPGCEADARHFYGDLPGLAEVVKPEPLCARRGVWFGVGHHLPGVRRYYTEDPWGNRVELLAEA